MGDIAVTVVNVKPLNGAVTRRGVLGGVSTPGMLMYLDGSNGWKPADADALASSQGRAILISLPNGGVTGAIGDACDLVVFGPVTGYASMTPGGAVFGSTTAGKMDQTAPAAEDDYAVAIGWAEQAGVIFVQPQMTVPVVNPS
jgi:hypothetical protein